MSSPVRIQRKRTAGWRMPEGAVYVGRPSKWGNPFKVGDRNALMRFPGAIDTDAASEYEGRISADGMDHDYHHPGGRVTYCKVRYMTASECVDHFRLLLMDDYSPSMLSAGFRWRPDRFPDIQMLRGHDLACWCPLDVPCHADVLLKVANR